MAYLSVSTATFYANALCAAKTTCLTWKEIEQFKKILAKILYDKTGGYFNIGDRYSRVPEYDHKIMPYLFKDDGQLHVIADNNGIVLMAETEKSYMYEEPDECIIDDNLINKINYYCEEDMKDALQQARDKYSSALKKQLSKTEKKGKSYYFKSS